MILADFANLIGCLLTHQLPFQKYLGMYFVFIDVCLLLQYIYYSKIKRKSTSFTSSPPRTTDDKADPLSKAFQHPSVRTPLLIEHATMTLEDELKSYSASASPSKWYTLNDNVHHHPDLTHCNTNNSSASTSSSGSKRNKQIGGGVLMAVMLFGTRIPSAATMTTTTGGASMTVTELNTVVIGLIFAWICTALYLMSRLPQILKNRRRKSVEGLSPALFAFAACGNLTYSCSVLLHPGHTRESLLEAVPYLIGSAGTLIFDATIFLQFLWYRSKNTRARRHHHPHLPSSSPA